MFEWLQPSLAKRELHNVDGGNLERLQDLIVDGTNALKDLDGGVDQLTKLFSLITFDQGVLAIELVAGPVFGFLLLGGGFFGRHLEDC